MQAVTDPDELPEKVEKVRKVVEAGQLSPQLFSYVVTELLVCVDAKASDYRQWLTWASQCAAASGQKLRAALLTALASGPKAALAGLPTEGTARERAYLLAAQARQEPVDASRLYREAAQQALSAGLVVSAALFFVQAGQAEEAQALWLRLLGGQQPPYERALFHAQLALLLLPGKKDGDGADGVRHAALAGQILEEIADEYETKGQRALALDCYRVLGQLGQQSGSFENVTEGYLGMLRIFKGERLCSEAIRVYDELLRLASQAGEHELCAEQCRDAAAFLQRCGLHQAAQAYLQRAAESLIRVAEVRLQSGATRLAEHALLSAADLLSTLPDTPRLAQVLGQLAALRSEPTERARYERLVALLQKKGPVGDQPKDVAQAKDQMSQAAALPEVWTLDLLEWEAGASPLLACLRLLLDTSRPELTRRHALLVLLFLDGGEPARLSEESLTQVVLSLGSLRAYEAIAPLAKLYRDARQQQGQSLGAALRGAIIEAMPRLPYPRALQLVVEALQDPSKAVVLVAQTALTKMGTAELLSAMGQLLSDSRDLAVKLAVVSALGRIPDPRAVERLLQIFVREADPLRKEARRGLVSLRDPGLRPLFARALLSVSAERAQDLHSLIAELFPSGV